MSSRSFLFVAVPLVATLSLGLPSARQAAPPKKVAHDPAEELLDRMEARRFGQAKDAGQGTMRFRGRINVVLAGRTSEKPLEGAIEIVFDGERMNERMEMGSQGTSTQVFDGRLMWDVHPVFGNRIWRGIQERQMLRVFGIVRGAPWRTLYTSAEVIREERPAGKTLTVVRLHDGDEGDVWAIDQASLLPVRIEMTMYDCPKEGDKKTLKGTPAKLEYDDWRPVAGIAFPFKERFTMEGADGATGVTIYDSIERGVAVDPHRFDMPAEIRALDVKQTADAEDVVEHPSPQVVQCEEQPVASIRVKIKADQVHRTLAQLLPEVMKYLTKIGASASGPPFARFHGEGEGEVDLEAGVPVAAPIAPDGQVKPSTLPGGRAAMVWHNGAYTELTDARARLSKAVIEMKLKPRGGAWIYYWTDPTIVKDAARRRSQILQPIE